MRTAIVLIALFISLTVSAQNDSIGQINWVQNNVSNDSGLADGLFARKIDVGGRLIYAKNQGTFGTRFGEDAIGFGFNLGYNLGILQRVNIPVEVNVGLNFDYLWFGGKSSTSGIYDININSNAYGWSPYLKLALDNPVIMPYFYATAGYRFFRGTNKVTFECIDNQGDRQTSVNRTNFSSDFSFFSGIGGGVVFKIVDVSLVYNAGRDANIVDPSSIVIDNSGNLTSYNTVRSITDMWLLSLGISF